MQFAKSKPVERHVLLIIAVHRTKMLPRYLPPTRYHVHLSQRHPDISPNATTTSPLWEISTDRIRATSTSLGTSPPAELKPLGKIEYMSYCESATPMLMVFIT